jgi:hypothetical protein
VQTTTRDVPAFVLAWQSPIMAAPAFWYFQCARMAETWHADMARRGYKVAPVEPRTIPAARAGLLLQGTA